jgi:hypothetical protein
LCLRVYESGGGGGGVVLVVVVVVVVVVIVVVVVVMVMVTVMVMMMIIRLNGDGVVGFSGNGPCAYGGMTTLSSISVARIFTKAVNHSCSTRTTSPASGFSPSSSRRSSMRRTQVRNTRCASVTSPTIAGGYLLW